MSIQEIILLSVYFSCLLFIFIYSIVQFFLLKNYLRVKPQKPDFKIQNYPKVCIQLPLYNEQFVCERIIDAICNLNYPKDKLDIQVLDDSTDSTVELVSKKVDFYTSQGFSIEHIRRQNREGYKAGALEYGLNITSAEFIAIFDADFIPDSDFLIKTIPYFESSSKIGVVQTRWGHINREFSLLTKLQAIGLDAHFTIEQTGRKNGNHFINFNGTAGIWRKKCITDAGGWKPDTLTEDLDLSYRAQLKKWEFIYLEDVISPAELPIGISALKSQQFRWTKGAAETALKLLPSVLRSNFKISTKIHSIFHLLNSTIFLCILFTSLLSVPFLSIKSHYPQLKPLFLVGSIFLVSFINLFIFYFVSYSRDQSNKLKAFLNFFPLFLMYLSVSMALSLHNSIAVLEAYTKKKSAFIRTPKFNLSNNWKQTQYSTEKLSFLNFLEIGCILYFTYALMVAYKLQDFGLLPFHLMLLVGYSYIIWLSIKHSIGNEK